MTQARLSNRGVLLALGALGLAGAAIALWLALRSDDGASARPPPAPGSAVAPATPPPALPGSAGGPERPVVSETERDRHTGSGEPPREVVIDGVRIRDHRKNGGQIDLPPNIHPPDSRKLQPETVAAINDKVYAAARTCVAASPREARTKDARLEGQVVVSIKNKQVSVTRSIVQLRDVTSPEAETIKQCIERAAIGLGAQAFGDERDVENYSISLSYALP